MAPVECKTPQEAMDLLHHCLDDGDMHLTKHFREELKNEKLDFDDVYPVLQNGSIFNPAEPDIKTGEWGWRIEGKTPDGKWIAIIVVFKTVDRVALITVFSVTLRHIVVR